MAEGRSSSRRFLLGLLCITAAALAIRLAFGLTVAADRSRGGVDADFYHRIAGSIADGEGYRYVPPGSRDGRLVATGQHPPLHPTILSTANLLGSDSWWAHRVVGAAASAGGVLALGLAGRRLLDARVGLTAAAIAAAHPLWFQHAGYVVAETTYLTVVPLALLAAALALERPDLWRFLFLGVAIGLCVLARTEAALLVPLLGAPVVWAARGRRPVRLAAVLVAGAVLVVGPWCLRQQREFGDPSPSFNGGVTLAGSNCEETYYGERLGGFGACAFALAGVLADASPGGRRPSEPAFDDGLRRFARDYAGDHLGRLPVVAAARVGRTVGVFRPGDSMEFDEAAGASRPVQWAGYALNLLLLPLAAVGMAGLLRRGRDQVAAVLAAGPVLALVTSVTVYGATRIRASAEPSIAILAASALVALWTRMRARDAGPRPEARL